MRGGYPGISDMMEVNLNANFLNVGKTPPIFSWFYARITFCYMPNEARRVLNFPLCERIWEHYNSRLLWKQDSQNCVFVSALPTIFTISFPCPRLHNGPV